jgi:hypothetical protein
MARFIPDAVAGSNPAPATILETRMKAMLSDVERVISQLRGAQIEYAEETDDGFHLVLNDGRTIVVIGDCVIAICQKKRTLN